MPKAAPSSRAAAKVTLSFGLIQVPIALYTGTVSDHGVTRKEYLPAEDGDHPVGRGVIDKTTGELIAQSDVVKKIETDYGPVYVEDHEIEELFSITPDTVVVKQFQPLHLFHQGHYVPKGINFIEPQVVGSGKKKGPDPLANKLLVTLFEGMRDKGACAIVEVTTRGVPKPGVITPDGVLWLVWHTDALREQRELPEVEVNPAEVQMMGTFIDQMWSTEPMDLTDERSALIQGLADEKAAAGDFDRAEEPERVAAPAAPTQDVMALLMASVEQAKSQSA